MMRFSLPFLGALLCAAVSTPQARADIVIAYCKNGGCECALSPVPAADIAEIVGDFFGSDTPADPTRDTLVIETDLGIVSWDQTPRSQINTRFGGNDECPIKLFPAPEAMVPLDGIWQWRTLEEATSSCPPMLAGALAASRAETVSARVVWDGRFDPQTLASSLPAPEMDGMSPYEWRELGPNRWLSNNINDQSCEDGTCVSMALTLSMTLTAPDRISGLLTLRSRIQGAQAAILAGFGMADCQVRLRYQINRVSP